MPFYNVIDYIAITCTHKNPKLQITMITEESNRFHVIMFTDYDYLKYVYVASYLSLILCFDFSKSYNDFCFKKDHILKQKNH